MLCALAVCALRPQRTQAVDCMCVVRETTGGGGLLDWGKIFSTSQPSEKSQFAILKKKRYIKLMAITKTQAAQARLERSKENKRLHKEGKKAFACQKVGTDAGNKQRMTEFKERLLKSAVGTNIINKIIDIATDDTHVGQMAALKMCIDRILPMSLFEEKKGGGERTAVTITIGGIGEAPVTINNNEPLTLEGEVL